ncbi:MAG: hypothetical protein WDN45_07465 [Caulobacteraceae bacterium]
MADAFRKAREVRFSACSALPPTGFNPTPEGRSIVRALNAAGARVSFVEIDSDKGHDAFLLDEPVMRSAIAGFLGAAGQTRGIAP